MWLLIAASCAAFSGGDRCNAIIPRRYFATYSECEDAAVEAQLGFARAAEAHEGRTFWFAASCVDMAAAKGVAL